MKTLLAQLSFLIFLITTIIILVMIWICSSTGYISTDNEMKSHLHKQVIIERDTMIIINYSITYNEYYLSDGRTISKHFIK